MRYRCLAPLLLALLLAAPRAAGAFSLFPSYDPGFEPREALQRAARWAAEPIPTLGIDGGLSDGIDVAVDPGFAAALGLDDPDVLDLLQDTITGAFDAWSNPALQFDIVFDGAAQEGTLPGLGAEIDLFAVPESHPAFQDNDFFGVTFVDTDFTLDRLLPNGQRFDGWVIRGADVFINVDKVLAVVDGLGLPLEFQAMALKRLLMHELGHALGVGHPNVGHHPNYDTDLDPQTPIDVDPADPFAGIGTSPVRDVDAIMSNSPALSALFLTELRPDDVAARDVLYAVPEAQPAALLAAALLTAGLRRRRRAVPAS